MMITARLLAPRSSLYKSYALLALPLGWSIAAYAQDLSIVVLEPFVLRAERGCLRRSTSGEIEYVEREDNYLFALVSAKGNIPVCRRKLKFRGHITNLCRHIPSLSNIKI